MGIIKRIFRQTSHRLLAKFGAQSRHQQLIINGSLVSPNLGAATNLVDMKHGCSRPTKSSRHRSGSNQSKSTSSAKKLKKRASRMLESSLAAEIPEALLLAAKNYLPPVQFHHVHGPNAQLSKNKCVARRTQSFCQALVFSNRIILPNERVYIKVLEIAKGWSGTIRFGFTSVDPATLRLQMPKHACPDMTNAGHTWARALADEVVRRNSIIHFSYTPNGYIHYGINNQDCGVFYANVNTSQHLWFIVDIYGLTAAVELIDPRVHNGPSELYIEDQFGSTLHKSTGAMDLCGPQYGGCLPASVRGKKKRSRRSSRHHSLSPFMHDPWTPEALMMSPLSSQQHNHQQQQGSMLPNLNSIILPTAQQNIYSPMPSLPARAPQSVGNLNEPHDYYQIMTNGCATNEPCYPFSRTAKMRKNVVRPVPSTANMSQQMPAAGTSSDLNSSTTRHANSSTSQEDEICQQLGSFQISPSDTCNTGRVTHQQFESKSSKSTANIKVPVAAARRRLTTNDSSPTTDPNRSSDYHVQNQMQQTKVIAPAGPTSVPCSTASQAKKLSGQSSISKAKARNQTSKTSKSSNAVSGSNLHDNNNNPPSKDCPICFERPINCVLYQCGHMCTCYECGVKQWRTQSRTCPICRTIIKDVIKTYMS